MYGLFQHVAYRKDFVDVICKSMRKSADPLKSLSKFNQNMIKEYRGEFDHTGTSSKNFAKFLRKAHQFGPDAGAIKLWTWQACTEFGFFPTTDSADEVFVHPTPLK
ncbi:hypothetical protein OESDEN_07806 [Oesophagostomum dentatum]|uniref:Uncharacterized protein n=1 Tax=Oesophagostomum dentatum TaxID=61180 RepID=A0A0B1T413_OESDE|nr:hypothetical protein OESDEN_07806 [Oesophagostomum dentatum]